jgi:hypothetical protein
MAIGFLFVTGVMFLLTSAVPTAVAQPVSGSGTPARAGHPGRRGTNIEARKEFESSGAAQRRVPCDQVISRVDHDTDVQRGHAADMSMVAKGLGTSITWVQRCMLAYGRRPKRSGVESAETTEQRLEKFEEEEPEEGGSEDVEEENAGNGNERPERPTTLKQIIRRRKAERREEPPQ